MTQIRFARTVLSRALGLALLGTFATLQAGEAPLAQPQPQPQADVAVQDAAQEQTADQAKQKQPAVNELSAVNVTGSYRSSLQFSTEAKRDATGFTDSIFAEDIGKFPDTNIAESLARIPGIQLTRDVNGEGVRIAIRGLGDSFTKTTINGNNSVATASISLGGTNQNREVDLNIFPTEFFSELAVYKSPKASLPEGGAAGIVDMRNAHAFDNPGRHVTYSLQAADNSVADKISPQGTVIGSWTNEAGTFGALVGVNVVRGRMAVKGWEDGSAGWIDAGLTPGVHYAGSAGRNPSSNSWGLPTSVPDNASTIAAGLVPGQAIDEAWLLAHNPNVSIAQIDDALVPYLPRPVDMSGKRDRDAMLGSLEWRPTDRAHFWVDYLYSEAERNNDRIDMDLVMRTWGGPSGAIPMNMQVDDNGVVTRMDLSNAQFFLEARPYREKVKYWEVDPGASFWFGSNDDVRLDLHAGASRSWMRREAPTIMVNSPFTNVQYTNSNGVPVATSLLDLNDPNLGWTWNALRLQNEHRLTRTKNLRADLQLGGDDKNNVKLGLAWDSNFRRIQGFDNTTAWQAYGTAQIPASALGQYLVPGPYGFITADFDALMAATNYAEFSANAPESGQTNNSANTGGFSENNRAAYIELNAAQDVFGRELRINAGVRYAETDQWISGPVTLGGERRWQVLKGQYGEWLPSFSAAWSVAPDVVLRLSGSKTMTRPNPSKMLPSTSFIGASIDRAQQGNPNLAPYISTNFDLGGEWYTGGEGYVGLTFFNKRIQGYTFRGQTTMTLPQLGVAYADLDDAAQALVDSYYGGYEGYPVLVDQDVNADAALNVRGWEATWVQPLDFVLGGLGFLANYTKINASTVGHDAAALAGNLYGVSPKMWNASVYWENYGFTTRLTYNWQQGAPGSPTGQNNLPFGYYYGADRGQLDLSSGYTFNGVWSQPQVTLNVSNLTRQKYRTYFGFDNMAHEYYEGGRTITLGIRGTF